MTKTQIKALITLMNNPFGLATNFPTYFKDSRGKYIVTTGTSALQFDEPLGKGLEEAPKVWDTLIPLMESKESTADREITLEHLKVNREYIRIGRSFFSVKLMKRVVKACGGTATISDPEQDYAPSKIYGKGVEGLVCPVRVNEVVANIAAMGKHAEFVCNQKDDVLAVFYGDDIETVSKASHQYAENHHGEIGCITDDIDAALTSRYQVNDSFTEYHEVQ